MQNIPREELLAKLDAGWTVRRKAWGVDACVLTKKSEVQIKLWQYLENDWEGEPPEPKLRHARCAVVFAFTELNEHRTAYIKRPGWCRFLEIYKRTQNHTLNIDDILSNDWEVWG